MRSLLLRDIRAYIYFFIGILIIMVLYSLLVYKVGSPNGLVGFLVVYIPSIVGIVLFVGDHELLIYTAAMPVSRNQLVLAKYISAYFFGIAMLIFTVLITWYLSGTFENSRIDLVNLISLKGALFSILPISLIVSISYPFLFRFGISTGTKILMGAFALVYAIGSMIGERMIQSWLSVPRGGIFANAMALFEHAEKSIGAITFYSMLITMISLLLIASIALSINWINKKDFN